MAGKPLTKSQLMALLSEKTGLSKKEVTEAWETIVDVILTETREAGACVVPGLGKMVKQHRKARMGRNPATGQEIEIPAKTVAKFRVAKAAKDAVLGS